jgi:hypothetical protein
MEMQATPCRENRTSENDEQTCSRRAANNPQAPFLTRFGVEIDNVVHAYHSGHAFLHSS